MKVTFIFDIHVNKYKGKLRPISWAPLKAADVMTQQYNSATVRRKKARDNFDDKLKEKPCP
jgi:hypothetical protein